METLEELQRLPRQQHRLLPLHQGPPRHHRVVGPRLRDGDGVTRVVAPRDGHVVPRHARVRDAGGGAGPRPSLASAPASRGMSGHRPSGEQLRRKYSGGSGVFISRLDFWKQCNNQMTLVALADINIFSFIRLI